MTFRITLLRHGLSQANKSDVVQGQLDFPLAEEGITQARLLAEYWQTDREHFDLVVSSPLLRARQTAEIVAAHLSLMIEFDPVSIAGNTLRRHWVVSFERGGERYFFADSKRPGHIAGPYASTQDFIAEYARYRGRRIVSFREVETYERKLRTLATRQKRQDRP